MQISGVRLFQSETMREVGTEVKEAVGGYQVEGR